MRGDWPIWVALALTGCSVVALGVWASRRGLRTDPLPAPVSSVPPLDLPLDRGFTAQELRDVRFETALRGYDPGPVDAHLEEWIQWLGPLEDAGVETPSRPAADVTFPVVLRGYRMEQVDELLAALDR